MRNKSNSLLAMNCENKETIQRKKIPCMAMRVYTTPELELILLLKSLYLLSMADIKGCDSNVVNDDVIVMILTEPSTLKTQGSVDGMKTIKSSKKKQQQNMRCTPEIRKAIHGENDFVYMKSQRLKYIAVITHYIMPVPYGCSTLSGTWATITHQVHPQVVDWRTAL